MNWRAFKNPFHIAALVFWGLSIWSTWPIITGKTYPHIPFLRGYGGMLLMILACSLASCGDKIIKDK